MQHTSISSLYSYTCEQLVAVVKMTSQGFNSVFSKVEKFDGKSDVDFSSWLRSFDRCCTIAQKDDALIKGQLLMLCLSGQALAVAEQLEEEKKAQQKYDEIKSRLESVFQTMATKEAKMVEFENRIQRIEESEDEFMLSLVKLYTAADPDAADSVSKKAIKRRFMNGISNEVRQSLYIFCNDPYSTTVTYQNLLEYARKAKMHIFERKPEKQSTNVFTTDKIVTHETIPRNNSILTAISNLDYLKRSMDSIECNYNNQQHEIYSIASGRSNYCGNANRSNYHGNANRYRNNRSDFLVIEISHPIGEIIDLGITINQTFK